MNIKKGITIFIVLIFTFFITSIQAVFFEQEILEKNVNQLLNKLGEKEVEINNKKEYFSPFFGKIFLDNEENETCLSDIAFKNLKYKKDLKNNIYLINSYSKNKDLLQILGIINLNDNKYCFYNYNNNYIYFFIGKTIYKYDKENEEYFLYFQNGKKLNTPVKNKLIKLLISKKYKDNIYFVKYSKTWDK